MNKYNKGKSVAIVTAALAAVALVGVGFSTWVIGIQNKETSGDVNIQADDVKYKSLTISTKFENSIVLAETASATGDSYFNYESNNRVANMTTTAKFTLTLGRDYVADDFDFDQISLSIAAASDGFVDNKPAKDGILITERESTDSLTYFDVSATIDITDEEKYKLNFDANTKDNLTKEISFEKEIEFAWGTMFDKKSPMTYYNAEVAKVEDKNAYVEKAVKELDTMHAKYYAADAKFKLNITFGKKSTSSPSQA